MEIKLLFSLSTFIELRERQPQKTSSPIDVTLLGILIEVSEVQVKTLSPIDVTLSGISIESNEEQLPKA